MKKPAAPSNLRNGLKWRDGRPRWEPSPANRALGIKGRDLRRLDGSWMTRGEAITAADDRSAWATTLREAALEGPAGDEARRTLRIVLGDLPPLQTDEDKHKRALVADLIEAAHLAVDDAEAAAAVRAAGDVRSVGAMIDAYFADPGVTISAKSREAYATQGRRIRARFGDRRVDSLKTGELRTWYVELTKTLSLANANQCMGAFCAMLRWAVWQDWIPVSPGQRLGLVSPEGRRVFFTVEEELTFVEWCDANGYADVADGFITSLWTGARPSDICAADLAALSGDAWRFVPIKTKKSKREALPGLTAHVKARVARRRAQPIASIERAFLVDPTTGRRHTPDTLGLRYREARGKAVAAGAVPATMAAKQLRDARDTCITRLWESDPNIVNICNWTGHSIPDAETVLREHYVSLREQGAAATAEKLATWARENGVAV